jgi:hypothetical protein
MRHLGSPPPAGANAKGKVVYAATGGLHRSTASNVVSLLAILFAAAFPWFLATAYIAQQANMEFCSAANAPELPQGNFATQHLMSGWPCSSKLAQLQHSLVRSSGVEWLAIIQSVLQIGPGHAFWGIAVMVYALPAFYLSVALLLSLLRLFWPGGRAGQLLTILHTTYVALIAPRMHGPVALLNTMFSIAGGGGVAIYFLIFVTSPYSFLLPTVILCILKVCSFGALSFCACASALKASLTQLPTPQACQGRLPPTWRRGVFLAEAVTFVLCGVCGIAQSYLMFTRSQKQVPQGVTLVAVLLRVWVTTALLVLVAAWFGRGGVSRHATLSSNTLRPGAGSGEGPASKGQQATAAAWQPSFAQPPARVYKWLEAMTLSRSCMSGNRSTLQIHLPHVDPCDLPHNWKDILQAHIATRCVPLFQFTLHLAASDPRH